MGVILPSLKRMLFLSLFLSTASFASTVFIDNKDGTITDVSTGLMWQKSKPATPLQFPAASQACIDLTLGGHLNWRLPQVKEQLSIVDYRRAEPAINILFFPGTTVAYWVQTSDFGPPQRRVFFPSYGQISELITNPNPYYNASLSYRCVRTIASS